MHRILLLIGFGGYYWCYRLSWELYESSLDRYCGTGALEAWVDAFSYSPVFLGGIALGVVAESPDTVLRFAMQLVVLVTVMVLVA